MSLAVNIRTLIVEQKSVYDEFMCPVTIVPTEVKCPILYSCLDESCIFSTDFYVPQYQNGYPSMGGRCDSGGQMDKQRDTSRDGHNEANRCFLQLFESA
jgi:hypothetical protein